MALVAALLAGGCFGTPASVGSAGLRPKRGIRTSAASPTPRPTPLPTIGGQASANTPRLTGPTPARTPSVSRSAFPSTATTATPATGLAFPDVAAQPVALNPLGSIGLAAETENYMVLSAAVPTALADLALAGEDAVGLAYREPAKGYALRAAAADDHLAFRRWQAGLPLPAPEAPRYAVQQAAPLAKGAVQSFWVITSFEGNDFQEVQIQTKVQEVGAHCYVVVDEDVLGNPLQAAPIAAKAKEIAETFDASIYPTNTRLFGAEPNPGIDKDPRIFILLTPAVGNYGTDTTLGYFSQRDEFAPKPDSAAVFKHSNVKEMLYISSRIVLKGQVDDYLGTIAHEFQHMINFNQKVLVGKNRASDDLWIDEGMAMYAIEANGYGLKAGGPVLGNHVKRYLQEPQAFSLTDWEKNPEGIGYGPVYLFMVYLADRFSESIIKEVVTSSKLGIENLNGVLKGRGTDFKRVFHDWAMANLLDGLPQVENPHHQYQSIELRGANGATSLAGIITTPLDLPGRLAVATRPYTARYYRLPDGRLSPRFTLTGAGTSVKALAVPRLVLPQEEF
jgi:hypothetical protein